MSIKHRVISAAMLAALCVPFFSHALEATAKTDATNRVGTSMQLDTLRAATQAILQNQLTRLNSILACAEESKFWDGSACVAVAGDPSQFKIESASFSVGLAGCSYGEGSGASVKTCTVNHYLPTYVTGDLFTGVTVSGTGTFGGTFSFNLYDLATSTSNSAVVYDGRCSSNTYQATVSMSYDASSKTLTLTSQKYAADSRSRCRSPGVVLTGVVISGQRLNIVPK